MKSPKKWVGTTFHYIFDMSLLYSNYVPIYLYSLQLWLKHEYQCNWQTHTLMSWNPKFCWDRNIEIPAVTGLYITLYITIYIATLPKSYFLECRLRLLPRETFYWLIWSQWQFCYTIYVNIFCVCVCVCFYQQAPTLKLISNAT